MHRTGSFLYALAVTTVFTTSPAHAYLDGATISLVLQAITGAVAGALLFGRTYVAKVASIFRRTPRNDDAQG